MGLGDSSDGFLLGRRRCQIIDIVASLVFMLSQHSPRPTKLHRFSGVSGHGKRSQSQAANT